jgi:hypothetical protein
MNSSKSVSNMVQMKSIVTSPTSMDLTVTAATIPRLSSKSVSTTTRKEKTSGSTKGATSKSPAATTATVSKQGGSVSTARGGSSSAKKGTITSFFHTGEVLCVWW